MFQTTHRYNAFSRYDLLVLRPEDDSVCVYAEQNVCMLFISVSKIDLNCHFIV
jgi:hypothetical protein